MPTDNPLDSAETLRIMGELETASDTVEDACQSGAAVTKSDQLHWQGAMDDARHRLAILQQYANGQGPHAGNDAASIQREAEQIEIKAMQDAISPPPKDLDAYYSVLLSNDDDCPTCSSQYSGRYCIDCGRDTRQQRIPQEKRPS